jgi:subtilisin-like proprotein convertase family protein/Ca2+-binding RTX toxin-like protein
VSVISKVLADFLPNGGLAWGSVGETKVFATSPVSTKVDARHVTASDIQILSRSEQAGGGALLSPVAANQTTFASVRVPAPSLANLAVDLIFSTAVGAQVVTGHKDDSDSSAVAGTDPLSLIQLDNLRHDGVALAQPGAGTSSLPTDNLFANQWHLVNTGQFGGTAGMDIDVARAWDDYTGAGVHVGVYDSGVQYDHPDLAANYDSSLSVIIDGNPHDPYPNLSVSGDAHGTNVAGLIAASNDGTGTVGVAYDAGITGVSIFGTFSDPQFISAFQQMTNFDVTNHSWGFTTPFADNILNTGNAFWAGFFPTLEHAVDTGRGGLGTIIVHSAGNDRTNQFNSGAARDTNDSNFTNSRFVVSVAAADLNGYVTQYSTPGAAVFVTAPGGGLSGSGGARLWTTDYTGANGFNSGSDTFTDDNATPDYDGTMNGTSGASPLVAGVVALMLEANPNLGWRDVQEILAYSARQVGTPVGTAHAGTWELNDWAFNGAQNWNGGGLHFNNDYGYGMVDAYAAVRLAETWTQQSTSANELNLSGDSGAISLAVPDNNATGVSHVFNSAFDFDIERVEVEIDWSAAHTYVGDLVIKLTSPSGMTSYLLNREGTAFNTGLGSSRDLGNWVFTSNAFRGESSNGDWTIQVADMYGGDVGTISGFKINFWGQNAQTDDAYIYNDEYGTYASLFGHSTTLTDTDGGIDTINAAAVSAASTIDLHQGAASSIDGTSLTIAAGTDIENAYGGDGADSILGNDLSNGIRGMRGADAITGGGGADDLDGGAGTDTAFYGHAWVNFTISSAAGVFTITDNSASGNEGTDTVRSIESFSFNGTIAAAASILNVAPVAVVDVSFSGTEDTAKLLTAANLVGNDTDANSGLGDLLRVGAVAAGAGTHGTVVLNSDGTVTYTPTANYTGMATFTYMAADSHGLMSGAATVTVNLAAVNDAPIITSSGGGATAAIGINENTTAVTTVTSSDPEGTARTYSIVSGEDGAKFSINSSTGALRFITAPDREAPTDADHNNVYTVIVKASDGSLFDTQTLAVTVLNAGGNKLVGTSVGERIDTTHGIGGKFATGEEDTLTGAGGNDTLKGAGGNDSLIGGAGNDSLTGSSGKDHFVFSSTISSAGIDRITDFTRGQDIIDLKGSIFTALGTSIVDSEIKIVSSGHSASSGDHLVYNKTDGTLWYDANGAAGGEIEFAILSTKPTTLRHADFVLV